ncbi:hypothetical protein QTP88_026370 [Uroleucon formosanum]
MSRKNMSKVWSYFEKVDVHSSKCKTCDATFNNKSSTTSLWNHYNQFHRLENGFDNVDTESSQSTNQDTESDQTNIEPPRKKHRMSLVSSAVNGRPLNQARQELITQSLSNMICVDMLPYNTVDHEGFRKFMNVIEPQYIIPSRKNIKNRIHNLYEDKFNSIKEKIRSINEIALTTDAWTSLAIDSYITITGHFIDNDWMLHCFNMYTGELSKNHTSEYLKETLQEVMENWNVDGKVSGITHDNAYNITKAIKKLQEDTNEGCRSMPCAVHTLQLAVNKGLGIDECIAISKKASSIVSAFKHSYKRTTALESYIINNVSNELSERFGFGIHNDNILIGKPKVSVFACLLDPRHKKLNHETSENVKEHIRHTVKSLIQSYEETSYENDHGQINKNTTAMDILLGEADISYNEFEQYISEIQINHNLDPCMWWKEHETIYPTIAKVAKNILCIPASSASSERVFSTAGNIVTSKRNRLNAKNVSTLVFLKQNNNI